MKLYALSEEGELQMDGMPRSSGCWPFPPSHCPACNRHLTVGGFRHAHYTPFGTGSPEIKRLWRRLKRATKSQASAEYWEAYRCLRVALAEEGIFCPVFTDFGPLNLVVDSEVDVGYPHPGTIVCHSRVLKALQQGG